VLVERGSEPLRTKEVEEAKRYDWFNSMSYEGEDMEKPNEEWNFRVNRRRQLQHENLWVKKDGGSQTKNKT
jgi:hypothetical protein